MAFELPELGYSYDALEPNIDARTIEIHHSKHHAAYTANLNGAIGGTDMAGKTIEELLQNHNDNAAVRNNGGGYWNHCFFWNVKGNSHVRLSCNIINFIWFIFI